MADPISTQFPSIGMLGNTTTQTRWNVFTVPAIAPTVAPIARGSKDRSNQPKQTPAATDPIRAQPEIRRSLRNVNAFFMVFSLCVIFITFLLSNVINAT